MDNTTYQPIAIIGMACRFPGNANTPSDYWELLRNSIDPIGPIPDSRWQHDPQKNKPITNQQGGYLQDIAQFDPAFFDISPKEAEALDPQQRILLEVCHEAFENAGILIPALIGSNTGAYVGISASDYAALGKDLGHPTGPFSITGTTFSTAAGRISYAFGLEGPSVALDSACASSHVAIHYAAQDLQTGHCDLAIAAAVSLLLKPDGHISFSALNMLSSHGRCHSFSDDADGYVLSEGGAAIVLKRLEDAVRDGDPILAVLKGSAVNHSGRSDNPQLQKCSAQESVLRQALLISQLSPEDIDYVETHGSGSKLGDPQEAKALNHVFAGRKRPLWIGSVKSNIGNLEAAAGMAGIIKLVMCMQHGQLTPNLHFKQPNKLIDWELTPLRLVDKLIDWPDNGHPRTAGITTRGINGSNAHLILQSYPEAGQKSAPENSVALSAPYLFTVSAKSPVGLANTIAALADSVPIHSPHQLAEWCRATNVQRSAYPVRFACLVTKGEELQHQLQNITRSGKMPHPTSPLPCKPSGYHTQKVMFVYPGQISWYRGIAENLYSGAPNYRRHFDECSRLFQHALEVNLAESIYGLTANPSLLDKPLTKLALTFSMEYALTQYWKSLGIIPGSVIGYGTGEYAAACEAGIINLTNAVDIIIHCGQFMEEAGLTLQDLHSPAMQDGVIALYDRLAESDITHTNILLYSTLTGQPITNYPHTLRHYWSQSLVNPVLFAQALERAIQDGIRYVIEIGNIDHLICQTQRKNSQNDIIFIPSFCKGQEEFSSIKAGLTYLYQAGADINWVRYHGGRPTVLPLPNTAWEHISCWFPEPIYSPVVDRQAPNEKLLPALANELPREPAVLQCHSLSSTERQMYVMSKITGNNSALWVRGVYATPSHFDAERTKLLFCALTIRHKALRTAYLIQDSDVQRVVLPYIEPIVEIQTATFQAERNDALMTHFPLNPAHAPLWRVQILGDANHEEGLLIIKMHRLISDEMSLSLLIEDFVALYQGRELVPLSDSYESFIKVEISNNQNDALNHQREYWRTQLQTLPPLLQLPTDYQRPSASDFQTQTLPFVIDSALTHAVRAASQQLGYTVGDFLLGCYGVLLYKLTRQNDICIGLPDNQRDAGNFARTLGNFDQTLFITGSLSPELPFIALVSQLALQYRQAYLHHTISLNTLINQEGTQGKLNSHALINVQFIIRPEQHQSKQLLRKLPIEQHTSLFDLSLEITENKETLCNKWRYATQLFKQETLKRWGEYFRKIVATAARELQMPIGKFSLLSRDELNRLLFQFNDTKRGYDPSLTLPELWDFTSHQVAVRSTDRALTYPQLQHEVDTLARYLVLQGAGPGKCIGIMLRRDSRLIVAMLATLKIGAAYVPLDPDYPQTRVAYMVKKSEIEILLSQPDLAQTLSFTGPIIDPGMDYSPYQHAMDAVDLPTPRAEELAYIIFTSGSTGQPKGVMVEQRNVVNFIYGMHESLQLPARLVTLGLTSLSFDIFALEVFLTLAYGGTLILASEDQQKDPYALSALIKQHHINLVQMTPSRLQLLLAAGLSPMEIFTGVELLLLGGEAFPHQHLAMLQTISNLRLFNVYGPTETTIWSSVKCLSQTTQVTLGKPIANTQMYVLDEHLTPLPVGQHGDLYIAGNGLARGYLNDTHRTNQVYITNPFIPGERMYRTGDIAAWNDEGELTYFGRNDNQIKLRGYRIELQDIEVALLTHPQVSGAAVTIRDMPDGNKTLVAFYITPDQQPVPSLKTYLRERLPEYMIPSVFMVLEDFPLTPNSKIDRNCLPHDLSSCYSHQLESTSAPRNKELDLLMQTLIEIWQQVLGNVSIAPDSNFFDIGGTSISLILMHSELNKRYPGTVEITDVFAQPTLRGLHSILSSK